MPISSLIFTVLAALSLLIWIVLTFFWGAFWLLHAFDDEATAPDGLCVWPQVVAIVPARNERGNIEPAISECRGLRRY